MTTWWGGEAWLTVPPPKRDIRDLIAASSFGDKESERLRASVSDEQVAEVLRRVAQADDHCRWCGKCVPFDDDHCSPECYWLTSEYDEWAYGDD